MQTLLASYSASCASNSSAYPNPLTRQTHLKITLCKARHLKMKEGLIPKEQEYRAAAGSSSTGQTEGSISSMSFKRQSTLPVGELHSWEETQALLSRKSSGVRGGLYMNGTCAHMRMCTCASKQVKGCMCICTKCACVGSMRIRRVLCSPCRRA